MSVVSARVTKTEITLSGDAFIGGSARRQEKYEGIKLKRVNGMVIGGAGYLSEISLFYLFCKSRKPARADEDGILEFFAEFQEWHRKKVGKSDEIESEFLLVVEKKLFHFFPFFVREVEDFASVGAGEDFAYAALWMGCSAPKATEVACELSPYCERPINTIKVKL